MALEVRKLGREWSGLVIVVYWAEQREHSKAPVTQLIMNNNLDQSKTLSSSTIWVT